MKRIVIKFGTGVLSKHGGKALDPAVFRRIATEVAAAKKRKWEVIIVSSGAIAAGVHVLGLKERPQELALKQACAAIGQPILMKLYEACFGKCGLRTAQLLLSHGDVDSRTRRANARNTLERLLKVPHIVPIINENDSVATEELKLGDNDRLSAEVAQLIEADLLLLLTSASGLMQGAKRLPVVENIESAFQYVTGEKGSHSVGGMQTKLEAVKIALQAGIPAVIADGRKAGEISSVLAGRSVGTRFPIG